MIVTIRRKVLIRRKQMASSQLRMNAIVVGMRVWRMSYIIGATKTKYVQFGFKIEINVYKIG